MERLYPTASQVESAAAFRLRAKLLSPDTNGDGVVRKGDGNNGDGAHGGNWRVSHTVLIERPDLRYKG